MTSRIGTVLVTGAGGFLGRAVVASALREGHRVRAQVRRAEPALDRSGVVQVVADLRAGDLAPLTEGVDAVVHCAAAKVGDFHTQYASTVRGTQRLLDAGTASGVRRFVLCSSFAVYDHDSPRSGALVDEASRIDVDNATRDAYAQTKVIQEQVVRTACAASGTELVVLRPGVVYAEGSWWTYRVGERFGRLWLALGNRSSVPLVHVDDCADALVLAASHEAVAGRTFNVLADDPPTQREFRRALAAATEPGPLVVPVPWPAAVAAARAAQALVSRSRTAWRLPGFLVPGSLAVRAKPLRFSNAPLRAVGWYPRHRWSDDLARAGA